MAFDKFLIAPINSGLVSDVPSWLAPKDSFARLNNAYIYKGKVRKRFGSTFMGDTHLSSRLRINLGNTDASGNFGFVSPGAKFKIGQMFSVGNEIFTVTETGTPGTMLTTGSATTHTFNTTDGSVDIGGADALAAVYFYPADSVMGITHYESGAPNNNPTYAFDTQFAYMYDTSTYDGWVRSGSVVFQGGDTDGFWSTNWLGASLNDTALYVTNCNASIGVPGAQDDPLYSFNGTTWAEFRPVFRVTSPNTVIGFVQSCSIIVKFKGRLLLLNTIENVSGTNYEFQNRCRYSWDGAPHCPVTGTPPTTSYSAWLECEQSWTGSGSSEARYGGAGWADAATEEEIISAEFINDRLIVYFERSTWELVWTGNEIQPFSWQKLNTEIGSESTFSTVGFDKAVLTVGSTGVHACNGVNVEKIDTKIEGEADIFQIKNTDGGRERVVGIRDYYEKMVYWSFPSTTFDANSEKFPNKLIMYNYTAQTWATGDDCITCFGYDENLSGTTWSPRQVLAGNQQGFVYIVDHEQPTNAHSMYVTDMAFDGVATVTLTIIDHTLSTNDYINIKDYEGIVFEGETFVASDNFKVTTVTSDTVTIQVVTCTGTYTGGGIVSRVSRIDILSKQWNPYASEGAGIYLAFINFCVKKTDSGQMTIDYFPSSTSLSGLNHEASLGCNSLCTYPQPLAPLELLKERLWHPVYFQAFGECIQIRIYLTDVQMTHGYITNSDFVLEGMMLHSTKLSEEI